MSNDRGQMLPPRPPIITTSATRPTALPPREGRPDDESKPMTRTELAMLWDGLGRWLATHPLQHPLSAMDGAYHLRALIDAELTERFGS